MKDRPPHTDATPIGGSNLFRKPMLMKEPATLTSITIPMIISVTTWSGIAAPANRIMNPAIKRKNSIRSKSAMWIVLGAGCAAATFSPPQICIYTI